VTLKGQGTDPDMLMVQYLGNGWRLDVNGAPIGKMAGDSDLVTTGRLQQMATWESSGHVTDGVT